MTMTTHRMASLRSWRKEGSFVIGIVYDDPNAIWEDGEEAVIGPGVITEETPTGFIFSVNNMKFKADDSDMEIL